MRRGRWVVYCLALFLVTPSFGAGLSMSATVPLSNAWKQALRSQSYAKIDTSQTHVAYITQYSLSIEKSPLENQLIQLLILQDGKMIHEQTKRTNVSGFTDFVFVSDTYGPYMILVVNISDKSPFIVRSEFVSF